MGKRSEKSISPSEQIFEQSGGVSAGYRGCADRPPAVAPASQAPPAPVARQASAGSGVVAGFDVPAEAALRRDVLDVAEGEPDLPGRNTGAEGLVSGTAAHPCQDQGVAQYAGVPRTELVVHKPPKVADPHDPSLSRPGTIEWLP